MKYHAVAFNGDRGTRSGIVASKLFDPLAKSTKALAFRHARAMKAVLLAAKAWAKAATAVEEAYERDERVSAGAPKVRRHLDATKRLLDAQARLAKIEKEVSSG